MSPAVCCGQYLPSGECCSAIYGNDRLVWEPDEPEPTCRYHDAPLVCGECGWMEHTHGLGGQWHGGMHAFQPTAHRITVCGVCGKTDRVLLVHEPDVKGTHPFQPVERDVPCEVAE